MDRILIAWTPEQVQTLQTEWHDGATGSQIGALLGVTRSAIMGKVSRLRQKAGIDDAARSAGLVRRKRRMGAQNGRGRSNKVALVPRSTRPIMQPEAPSAPIVMPSPVEGGVPLLDLKAEHCRAVIARDPGSDGLARFCGGQVTVRLIRGKMHVSSYCAGHHKLFHQESYLR